ncbi:hypothetical protein DM860_016857 [Cuscuta australis]|uniref:Uncharacterized protein n=1 Tax=Cuscuta australis TaxID=267555 RepID=A0A328DYT6_9ASTE|nr:hypothetical protein DM860_016857 [Cuscuta australis]
MCLLDRLSDGGAVIAADVVDLALYLQRRSDSFFHFFFLSFPFLSPIYGAVCNCGRWWRGLVEVVGLTAKVGGGVVMGLTAAVGGGMVVGLTAAVGGGVVVG